MEIEVIGVQDAGFAGNDGPVAGASLAYKFNGEEKVVKCYGRDAPAVLQWAEGSKHEIELYTTKSGKPSFKIPQAGGGFGGGGFSGGGKKFEPAYRNTEAGQKDEQRHMDLRTAAMQATFEGKFNVAVADAIAGWLQSKNGG